MSQDIFLVGCDPTATGLSKVTYDVYSTVLITAFLVDDFFTFANRMLISKPLEVSSLS
jgi:hypothetical protein